MQDFLPQWIPQSWPALVAYLFAVVFSFLTAFRVKRHQVLLKHLEKLPEKDRRKVVEAEMGVHLKEGMTAEEFIKFKRNQQVFHAVVVLMVLAAILIGISFIERGAVYIEPIPTTTTNEVRNAFSQLKPALAVSNSTENYRIATELFLGIRPFDPARHQNGSFRYTSALSMNTSVALSGRGLTVKRTVPYVHLSRRGGPVCGIAYADTLFSVMPTEVPFAINNSEEHTITVKELVCSVDGSSVDHQPVIVFREDFDAIGELIIENFGWGPVLNPKIHFRFARLEHEEYSKPKPLAYYEKDLTHLMYLKDFGVWRTNLLTMVPSYLHTEAAVALIGTLEYADYDGNTQNLRFQTRVAIQPPQGGAPPITLLYYDLYLQAGASNYNEHVPMALHVPSGGATNVIIRVWTDRSGTFDTRFAFKGLGTGNLREVPVRLDIFKPAFLGSYKHELDPNLYPTVSRAFLTAVESGDLIRRIARHPKQPDRYAVEVEFPFIELSADDQNEILFRLGRGLRDALRLPDEPIRFLCYTPDREWQHVEFDHP